MQTKTSSNAQVTKEKKSDLLIAQHNFAKKLTKQTYDACVKAMESYMIWMLPYPPGAKLLGSQEQSNNSYR